VSQPSSTESHAIEGRIRHRHALLSLRVELALAAGAIGEAVGSAGAAGAVAVLAGSPAGLTGAGSRVFTPDSPGVPGTAEHDDLFGGALAADN
jgi:hypothetical protein